MALYLGNKEISLINIGNKSISFVYKGAIKIWEAIKSCFGKGFWLNEYPWNNTDAWKNNA